MLKRTFVVKIIKYMFLNVLVKSCFIVLNSCATKGHIQSLVITKGVIDSIVMLLYTPSTFLVCVTYIATGCMFQKEVSLQNLRSHS